MNVLVTGGSGQLGSRLAALLPDARVLARAELDLASAGSIESALAEHTPDLVINAAAWTAVDDAESQEDAAYAVNAAGPAQLATALAASGGRLIQFSTDYVFAGSGTTPYRPGDPTQPRTAYGRTKLAGERAVAELLPHRSCVVRTAWVYGGPSANFVDTMVRLEASRPTVDVVDDQTGSPTYAADLAQGITELAGFAERGEPFPAPVLHFANSGIASWYELARETFRLRGADPGRVHPTDSAAFARPAPRPAWSVLSLEEWNDAGLRPPRSWQSALADYLGDPPAALPAGGPA